MVRGTVTNTGGWRSARLVANGLPRVGGIVFVYERAMYTAERSL
jgi:hypothetical protein